MYKWNQLSNSDTNGLLRVNIYQRIVLLIGSIAIIIIVLFPPANVIYGTPDDPVRTARDFLFVFNIEAGNFKSIKIDNFFLLIEILSALFATLMLYFAFVSPRTASNDKSTEVN